MNLLSGWKTYTGGVGLILLGLGGLIAQKMGLQEAITNISAGLAIVGGRAFGQKLLDALKLIK